ncbi:MerR family transcriptional regulator [Actinospica durhamensis]|uniref:MerR family transcriptional regulator n=1 Tax=Actinospica durhamensis TaxID=1508375 RepID=A0A941EU01_9ACTN|nr:MerR family transcriptional regulator [Actinospica durhamensis]MBR7838067.1 MerR family transcriptional regulator [Actinospica durhamensis]
MTGPDPAAWTIEQLSELVAEALSADHRQVNGRVRQVPDVRTIRWYTSIGLLDRPGAMRGRTALYGRRHLAQIVAVKRLQARGLTLADVQQQLIGADDATLERIAGLGDAPEPAPTPAPAPLAPESGLEPEPARGRFWSARPLRAPTTQAEHTAQPEPAEPFGARMHGIRLAPDVSLLLDGADHAPDDAAIAVLTQAARPLLDALRALGLSSTDEEAAPHRRGAAGAVRRGTP